MNESIDWAKWVAIVCTVLGGAFTFCSGVVAYFMRREMARFDEDRATVRRLDKESVSRDEFITTLEKTMEQFQQERIENREDRIRLHNEAREDLREIRSLVKDGLNKLECTIEDHEKINQRDRHKMATDLQTLKFTVASINRTVPTVQVRVEPPSPLPDTGIQP